MIDAPGDYKTRDGRKVTIHDIGGMGTCSARGSIWKTFRGHYRPRGYQIWQPNGRFMFVGDHPLDIIGPWKS